MSYKLHELKEPTMTLSGSEWVVDVPQGKAIDAVKLAESQAASGYKFNRFTGVDQATFDEVMNIAKPEFLIIAGFEEISYEKVTPSLKRLVLGFKAPWPDFSMFKEILKFTTMRGDGDYAKLSNSLEHLSMFDYRGSDLSFLEHLYELKSLVLSEAKNLRFLKGMPRSLDLLRVVRCNKLENVDDLKDCSLKVLQVSGCKKLKISGKTNSGISIEQDEL